MAIRYVRPGGTGNGTSWALAWGSLSSITGVSGGDIVYIGAGTYTQSQWIIPGSNNSANPIIYRAAQDTYTGTATITLANGLLGTASGNAINGVYLDGNFGGARNITLNATVGWGYSITGYRQSYVNHNGIFQLDACYNFELDHCLAQPVKNCDHYFAKGGGSNGTASYTTNSVHDNLIYLYGDTNATGGGDDGFQWIGNCSIYNNAFINVPSAGTYTNHQDYFQTDQGYLRIYNNYFEGTNQYFINNESSCSNWQIFNNVFRGRANTSQHIGLGLFGTCTNILIANNTFDNGGGLGSAICIGLVGSSQLTNSYIVNNIMYDCSNTINTNGGAGVVQSNNYSGTANIAFVSRANYPNNNFRLTAAAIAAINQGINPSYLTAVYTTDADGYTRNVGAWDIGAYEYGASGGGTPPTGTITLSVR